MSTTQETTNDGHHAWSVADVMPGVPEDVHPHHPHVFRALWALMRDVSWVGKTGQMSGSGGKYAFREVDQVIAALGHHARHHGLALQSTVIRPPDYVEHEKRNQEGKVTVWTTARGLVMEYRWTSLVDGSTFSTQAVGEGRDSADKATNKALTAAYKYALTQGTLLPTFDPDPDQERPAMEEEPRRREQGSRERPRQQQEAPPAEEQQRHPSDVLAAIRQAPDHSQLDSIHSWLAERDLLERVWEEQTFAVHLEAARRILGPRT